MTTSIHIEECPRCGAPIPPDAGQRLTCPYCFCSLVRQAAAPAEPGTPPPAEHPQKDTPPPVGAAFKTISCIDQQGLGMEAFRLLIPSGWEFQGGIFWGTNNPGMPAVAGFRAFNPQGSEALEVFPNLPFYWSSDPMTQGMFPVGSYYFGNEVRPPLPALQTLEQLVLPRYRGQALGLRVVQREHLPNLAQQLQASNPPPGGAAMAADGGRLRLQYEQSGQTIEEDLYGVVEMNRMSIPGMFGVTEMIFWMADYLFSIRARTGQLEQFANLFMTMLRSFRTNPEWYARYMQVSQYMIQNQIQHIQNVGQVSRMISQNSNQISDQLMDSFYQRQKVYDRISENFSQAIRGVDQYQDPFRGQGVELPGGYQHAWANNLGEYILSDDPNYNPNINSNQTWEQMEHQ